MLLIKESVLCLKEKKDTIFVWVKIEIVIKNRVC